MSFVSADELRQAIEPELEKDESVVWTGRPDPAKFSREVMRACLLVLATIVLLGVVSFVVLSHFSRFINTRVPAVLMLGSMVAYLVLTAPWSYQQRIRRTVYAITNRRVMIHRGVGWSLFWLEAMPDLYRQFVAFDARQVRGRRRIQRYPGRTDLIFGGESHLYMTGKGQLRDWIQVGFLGLANFDEVDELLDRQFANVDTEWT